MSLQVAPLALLLLTLAGVALLRARPPESDRAWIAAELAPAGWLAACALALVFGFAGAAGLPLWPGGPLMAISSAALCGLVAALAPGRWRGLAAGALLGLLCLLTAMDLPYLRYFGSLVSAAAAGGAGLVGRILSSVLALYTPADLWLAPLPLAAAVMALGWPRRPAGRRLPRRLGVVYWIMAAFPLLLAGAFAPALMIAGSSQAAARCVVVQKGLIGRWGFLNVHLFEEGRALAAALGERAPGPEERRAIDAVFDARVAEDPGPGDPWFGAAAGANVLLIHMESFQAFARGAEIDGQPVTPFLDRWVAEEALWFPEIYDQTNQGRSSDAQYALLNSLHPLDRGALVYRYPANRFVALPGLLREAGYATLSAFPYDRGFWNSAVMHHAWGFTRSLFDGDFAPGERVGWGLSDPEFLSQMAPQLLALERPWFAFLVPLTLHHPFEDAPPRDEWRLALGGLEGTPLGNYLQGLSYLDAALEGFFGELERAGALDDTLVVLYGDHIAGLPDSPQLQALLGEDARELTLQRSIPLIIRLPGEGAPRVIDSPGGHVDIAPTILHLLGLERPRSFVGTSLLPTRDRAVSLANRAVVTREVLYAGGAGLLGDCESSQELAAAARPCRARPSLAPLPEEACAALEERAAQELDAARAVPRWDLAAALAGED
jgi:phosphoglycerol transferase MdoB-like AlkP superfamily enzyme